MKMRRLFLGIGMFCVTGVFAQQNTPSVSNNVNGNAATNSPGTEIIFSADSTQVLKKLDTKSMQLEERKEPARKAVSEKKKQQDLQQNSEKGKIEKTEDFRAVNKELEEMSIPAAEESDSPSVPQAAIMQEQFVTNQYSSNRQVTRRSASPVEQSNMDAAVGYYNAILPNSFESHFYTYLAGHYNTVLFPELEAAAALEPENTEVKKQLAAYHIITQDKDEALPIIADLIEEDIVSQGQLLYANDLLLSNEENAVLVLHGFDDMFAAYYMQQNASVRNDVELLSLDFMQSETYRNQWKEKGYVLPESTKIDTAYLGALCKLNPEKPMQLSMTIPKEYFVPVKANLYPVGLTFRYSSLPVNNYESNYRLWKQDFDFGLLENEAEDRNDNWCTNYLPMLVSLKKQLAVNGNKAEEELVGKTIRKIGEKTGTLERVKKY